MAKTTNTQTLVNEALTKDEVMSLLNETLNRKGDINNYLTINKGTYTAWDGEVYDGYIVCHNTKTYVDPKTDMTAYKEQYDYYFMEVTLEEVNNPMGTCHLWEPTFYKLMPISEKYKSVSNLPEKGDAKDLCNYIVSTACRDKWAYTEVPMTEAELKDARRKDWYWYRNHTTKLVSLTYNDIYGYWSTPLTKEEQKQRNATLKAKENALIRMFSEGELPPAEDTAWYGILSTGWGTEGYELECKIIKILKQRGFNVYIDGERDSFGWVTRGIWVDGQMMCIY